MSSLAKRRPTLRYEFTTFDRSAVAFLYGCGAKIKQLYERDGVACFEVKLKGRRQLKALTSSEYVALASQFDVVKSVVAPRLTFPLFTLKVNGQFAILQDAGTEEEYFGLSKDASMLGQTSKPSELVEINTWEELQKFVEDGLSLDYRLVKIFVCYGEGTRVPYRETHDLKLLQRVIEERMTPLPEVAHG